MAVGRSVHADQDAHASPLSAPVDDLGGWSASLVEPTGAIRADSRQQIAVKIHGPMALRNRVMIGIETRGGYHHQRWQEATWQGAVGVQRTAVATLGRGGLTIVPGVFRVLVRVRAGTMEPTLHVGSLLVT